MREFRGRTKQERKRRGKNTKHNICDDTEDTNKLLLEGNTKKIKSTKKKTKLSEYEQYIADKIIKQKRRKLENTKKRKDLKKERLKLYEQLKSYQVSSEQLSCFTSSVKLGMISNEDKNRIDDKSIMLQTTKSSRKRKSIFQDNLSNKKRPHQIINIIESTSTESSDNDTIEIEPNKLNVINDEIVDTAVVDDEIVDDVVVDDVSTAKTTKNSLMDIEPVGNIPIATNQIENQNIKKPNPTKIICVSKLSIKNPPSYVLVNRDPEIQRCRLQLPIVGEEQSIMEEISNNDIVIITGETGSGKTTQLPQFLYEAGYSNKMNEKKCMRGIIGITEPRRVATIAMSERVGTELGFKNNECSYKIRHDGTVSSNTQIKFMTDGVLIKEIENDFMLYTYSVIIIDEAHERSLHTDILLGLLSRIVNVRKKRFNPLKLIIMSATLQIEQFENNKMLFPIKIPPVIKISARQYSVAIHFSKKTPTNYLKAAYDRVCKIHKKFPPHGSILVFVTSQKEVNLLTSWLRLRFSETPKTNLNSSSSTILEQNLSKRTHYVTFNESSSDNNTENDENRHRIDELLSDSNDMDTFQQITSPMIVYPLYANLPIEKQRLVFQISPQNIRHCIVATNVAETSITIPNIRYVVDTGKVKQRLYDSQSSATTFDICWCSKASAEQRKGRAGRTAPGHCYRLYSSVVYQYDMPDFTEPDILRQPLESVILQMKCLGIAKVENFPFPTPPSKESIINSENLLIAIGALEKKETINKNDILETKIICAVPTLLGYEMAKLPISPRFSIMLLKALQFYKKKTCDIGIILYIIILISSFSVRDLFLPCETDTDKQQHVFNERLKWISKQGQEYLLGDFLFIIKLIGASLHYTDMDRENYCSLNRINQKSLNEVFNLIGQLRKILRITYECELDDITNIPPPKPDQINYIREIILYGFLDHIAIKRPTINQNGHIKHPYECGLTSSDVYIHPSSVLSKRLPKWILFVSLHESSNIYMNEICIINPEKLIQFESFCHYEISKNEIPKYDEQNDVIMIRSRIKYGPQCWPIPFDSHIPMRMDTLEFYKILAMFFLDGTLFHILKQFNEFLLFNPKNLLKTDQIYNKDVRDIIDILVRENIHNRKEIQKIWAKNNQCI